MKSFSDPNGSIHTQRHSIQYMLIAWIRRHKFPRHLFMTSLIGYHKLTMSCLVDACANNFPFAIAVMLSV